MSLAYWVLTGGSPPGKVIAFTGDIESLVQSTYDGLYNLINYFDNQITPYTSIPNPENVPRFNDYEHLARVKEWSTIRERDV